MIKAFFDKENYFWLFLILTIFISYGYFIFNSPIGIDDEILNVYSQFNITLNLNRPLSYLFSKIFHNDSYIPFFFEFFAMIIFTFGISYYTSLFRKYIKNFNKISDIIFSCVAVSFPFYIYLIIFLYDILLFSINIFISALALDLFYKNFINYEKKNILYLVLCLITILSNYETIILFLIISILFIELMNIINDKTNVKELLKKLALITGLTVFCYALNMGFVSICKKIVNNSYSRIDEFFKYDLSSLSSFMVSAKTNFITFFKDFYATCNHNFGSQLTVVCCLIFIIMIMYYSIKKKNLLIALIGFIMMLIPFAIFLALGNTDLPYRNFITLGFFNAFVITMLYMANEKNEILSKILIFLAGIIIFNSALEINKTIYTENLKFQHDRELASSIWFSLQQRGLENKPVIFIGLRENPKLKWEYYKEAADINISIFNWDRYDNKSGEIFVLRGYNFMRELGFPIEGYFEKSHNDINFTDFINQIENQVKGMETYPRKNSIKETDEYTLIKLGQSEFDKKSSL